MKHLLSIFWLQSLLVGIKACLQLVLTVDKFEHPVLLSQLPEPEATSKLEHSTGRATYVAKDDESTIYLYHVLYPDGSARWVLNTELGQEEDAIAFADSWAIAPHLIGAISDNSTNWRLFNGEEWTLDPSFQLRCADSSDDNIYFESNGESIPLSGFYMLRQFDSPSPVYTQIKTFPADDQLFLFKFEGKWLIGNEVGMDACVAFLEEDVASPVDSTVGQWNYLHIHPDDPEAFTWEVDEGRVIARKVFDEDANEVRTMANIYDALRFHRSIKSVPTGQGYLTLRNGIPMPTLGLGTGGLMGGSEVRSAVESALGLGYRLFDSAREYQNEFDIGDVIRSNAGNNDMPHREEVFLESKVWPTELGFEPTTNAVAESLYQFRSTYIDLYLLHWPRCDASVSWMHCETAVDPEATWLNSWFALEKAYAEGRVNSIGVSNFDIGLLNVFSTNIFEDVYVGFSVKPHVVQNWAEPGSLDLDVLEWCQQHSTIFQPYASLRNLHQLSSKHRDRVAHSLAQVSASHGKSTQKTTLRFLVQAGFSVIPRSRTADHQKENMEIFDWELLEEEMEALFGFHDDEQEK